MISGLIHRAVAVHAPIRNVLQFQPSSSGTIGGWNGAGSSSWGGSGTGAGGTKYNAGGKAYSGYTGAGRAVTQANSATNDGTTIRNDDEEDLPGSRAMALRRQKRSRLRARSQSVSLASGRDAKLGVLKTIQLHARSRHAFSHEQAVDSVESLSIPPERPTLTRRNSTSASFALDGEVPASEYLRSTDPAAPQTAGPPPTAPPTRSAHLAAIEDAVRYGDPAEVREAINAFRLENTEPSIWEYNAAIDAVLHTRPEGEPVIYLLEIYHEMLARSVVPDTRTYLSLIQAFTERDHEISLAPNAQELLQEENTFASAMSFFEALVALTANRAIPVEIYHNLVRACAVHSNVEAAIHVFECIESRSDLLPTAAIFQNLLEVFSHDNDLEGAKMIFAEYTRVAKEGRIGWNRIDVESARVDQLNLWNTMVQAHMRSGQPGGAIELLERMMDTELTTEFSPAAAPAPASSTFSVIIAGFCQSGDLTTALAWFDQLLQQEDTANSSVESVAFRPDQAAWNSMIETLAAEGMVEDLNRLFLQLTRCAVRDNVEAPDIARLMVIRVNFAALRETDVEASEAVSRLDFIADFVRGPSSTANTLGMNMVLEVLHQLITGFIKYEAPCKAIPHLSDLVRLEMETLDAENSEHQERIAAVINMFYATLPPLIDREALTFGEALTLMRTADSMSQLPGPDVAPFYLNAYTVAFEEGIEMSNRDWELLTLSAISLDAPDYTPDGSFPVLEEFRFKGLASLVGDLAAAGVDVAKFESVTLQLLVHVLASQLNIPQLEALLHTLPPAYVVAMNSHRPRPAAPSPVAEDKVVLTGYEPSIEHSRHIDMFYPKHPTVTPQIAYRRFEEGMHQGVYPVPSTIGRLINALGRLGEAGKVRTLYDTAQLVLASMEDQKHWQSVGWFEIEDQMIIAHAYSGDVDAAQVHRVRIMEQGGSPTADAYAALIQCVKDTTDDTSSAMALFQESQARGVQPNIYLYNTTISKLAKARKADFALELFEQMKANRIYPSSITYGAVIAACARVGDVQAAEVLFAEMVSNRSFKPRIPPYNTMMQLYTQTKPDRERVLYYYNAMLEAHIKPSAHTYKLLIDAYATIEPIDISAMEDVFRRTETDHNVQVQGTHWAALINAWGCGQKNFDKAIAVFDSIATHPSTARSKTPLPDAVTFEALLNVLVTHKRVDMFDHFLSTLRTHGVHMTAYIANFMIKGYAADNDLEKARAFFEGLRDPAQGVAAPNNHVPHEADPVFAPVPASAPVYREPSTWEAMVRAELGAGNRNEAVALLGRLAERKFPVAVYNRISGIMLDDSVSPWASDSSSSSPSP